MHEFNEPDRLSDLDICPYPILSQMNFLAHEVHIENSMLYQARLLTPVTPALWEAEVGRSRVQIDHPGQHGETLSVPKIQKLGRRGGRCL